ncbi:MAG: hypothetical protein KJ048_01865 [Dehalococcoidia bacterium]|nr:hypothetical protein [Dehalococcoidia bacterium]
MTTLSTRKQRIEVALRIATLNAANYRPLVLGQARMVEVDRKRPTTIRLRYDWR